MTKKEQQFVTLFLAAITNKVADIQTASDNEQANELGEASSKLVSLSVALQTGLTMGDDWFYTLASQNGVVIPVDTSNPVNETPDTDDGKDTSGTPTDTSATDGTSSEAASDSSEATPAATTETDTSANTESSDTSSAATSSDTASSASEATADSSEASTTEDGTTSDAGTETGNNDSEDSK